MNKIYNQKAITLIALVVTIIILLILAGVTIGFAMNGTGLFEQAKLATDKYNNSVNEENSEFNNFEYQINSNSRETINISKDEYNNILERLNNLEKSQYITETYSANISAGNLYIPNTYGTNIKAFVNVIGSYSSSFPWVCNTVVSENSIYCAVMNSDFKWFNGTINVQYLIIPNNQNN